ncbi:hypothetical protein LDI01_23830 [Lentilactobacillus diolivorans]|uniref:Uncharacterized protein n=1 Tax=Lentilactobacillus diolivorans TaxID=179838 RepID=A0ABQ0XFV4_9LACO|nr:hypothetical protein LDI01_23830 [Lentilactobacillus diolivorans]
MVLFEEKRSLISQCQTGLTAVLSVDYLVNTNLTYDKTWDKKQLSE